MLRKIVYEPLEFCRWSHYIGFLYPGLSSHANVSFLRIYFNFITVFLIPHCFVVLPFCLVMFFDLFFVLFISCFCLIEQILGVVSVFTACIHFFLRQMPGLVCGRFSWSTLLVLIESWAGAFPIVHAATGRRVGTVGVTGAGRGVLQGRE